MKASLEIRYAVQHKKIMANIQKIKHSSDKILTKTEGLSLQEKSYEVQIIKQ